MRLISVTLRNYRIHRELQVTFDAARTLIGGDNETGKSTLIEAIHHGLFLKARVTGEVQASLVSRYGAGAPEVEVTFEIGAERYTIAKRFSGQSGTVQLRAHGGQTWHGDEAESRLAALLGVEEVSGGRGLGTRVREQWAHLWVWQGTSGDDPARSATEQHQALIQRLQASGGAVVVQSALDQRLAEQLNQRVNQIFTQAGKPRQHSDLERAYADVEARRFSRDERRAKLEQLEQAMRDVEQAKVLLADTAEQVEKLTAEVAEAEMKQRRIEALRQQEQAQQVLCDGARQALDKLMQAETDIAEFRQQSAVLIESLKPRQDELSRLQQAHEAALRVLEAASKDAQAAAEAERVARRRKTLGDALRARFDRAKQMEALERQAQIITKLNQGRDAHQEALERLPKITPDVFDALGELLQRRLQAEAALQAMAAGIEVVAAAEPIEVGGVALAEGETRIVTEATEVLVGSRLHLRIRPGGGDALETARLDLAQASEALEEALESAMVKSREEAATVLAERQSRERAISEIEIELKALKAHKLPKQLDEARSALNEAEGELERRREALLAGEQLPETADDASAWAASLSARLDEAEAHAEVQQTILVQRTEERERLDEAINLLREGLQGDQDLLTQVSALLQDRLSHFGEDATRAVQLTAAKTELEQHTRQLAALGAELSALQPELIARDLERLRRSLVGIREQRQAAETRKGVAETILRSDGTQDPAAEAALAEAELERAEAHLAATRQRAEAIKLLAQMFAEEQRQLVDHYTQPLADKITEYLRCLYGPDARAVVTWKPEQQQLSGIQLARGADGSPLEFERLSGGTKEQVAAAVRLAVAEVLADEHGLPVVLDDAFAYSDPGRVRVLQRMLDLAAERGLQVIVLSCTPGDYAGLGAQTIHLARPLERQAEAIPTAQTLTVPAASPAPATDEDSARLLEALQTLGGHSGNISLQRTLGWDDQRYQEVKDRLVATGSLLVGGGRGGSVSLR